jgi:hypothetical protein
MRERAAKITLVLGSKTPAAAARGAPPVTVVEFEEVAT